MVNYGSLTVAQRVLMGTIVIFTNAFGIPSIVSLYKRKGLQFQALIMTMAVVTSTMYHLCQVLHCDLFLEQLKWHRLDNVFVITSIAIWTLHITGSGHARKIIYLSLAIALITQQKDPWNLTFTIIPIAIYDVLAVITRLWYWNRIKVTYNYFNLGMSLGILLAGAYFFYKGLDQFDDYLRFNHGIWHLMAAISNYYGMNCTTWEERIPIGDKISAKDKKNTSELKQY